MIGAAKLLPALSRLARTSKADATTVCAQGRLRRVSRFAYGAIHQDILQETLTIWVKVWLGRQAPGTGPGQAGVAVTDTLEPAALRRCLARAMEIARVAPPLKSVPPLPVPSGRRPSSAARTTASPHHAPRTLKHLFHVCEGLGVELAGSCMTGADEMAVVNSAGLARYHASRVAGAKLVTMYRALSGFASTARAKLEDVDLEAVLERALKQCFSKRDAVTLPLGTYEVILEPEAIGELITWLGYTAFGAKSFQERTSFLAGRIGERVMAPEITIYDDGTDPAGLRMPFDFEGVSKRRVLLIDRGKAAGIVYDSAYGALYHQPSTGHALSPDDVEGPLPLHLGLAPGRTERAEIIKRCRRGILIPRFHYVNGLLNPREALMTGLTREGAWLIEDGKLVAPITTLRFTQSVLEALSHVVAISSERALVADPAQDLGCAIMPTVHVGRFRFTGRSESA